MERQGMATMIWAAIHWSRSMQRALALRMPWFARRLPAEPMRLQRRFPEISVREMNCSPRLESRMIPLRKLSASVHPSVLLQNMV